MNDGFARFSDRSASRLVEVRTGRAALRALDTEGFWAVVWTFEGEITALRFESVSPLAPPAPQAVGWDAPAGWSSSLDRSGYEAAVRRTRQLIAEGEVYQVNICRILSAELDPEADLTGLDEVLRRGNPAPHAARIHCPSAGLDIVSASPELFMARRGDVVVTRPIKGTAPTPEGLLPKDRAENVMIVDLMRNDLSRICRLGTVAVSGLCAVEEHPGLVHLVSTVSGNLRDGVGWEDTFDAVSPAGSVSGAPKSSALRAIAALEPTPRGPYCGAIGWVDADRGEAELAVGIRTFWATTSSSGRQLHFGTGAGITWGSDPAGEWAETELKAARLVRLASGVALDSGAQR